MEEFGHFFDPQCVISRLHVAYTLHAPPPLHEQPAPTPPTTSDDGELDQTSFGPLSQAAAVVTLNKPDKGNVTTSLRRTSCMVPHRMPDRNRTSKAQIANFEEKYLSGYFALGFIVNKTLDRRRHFRLQ